MDDRIKLPRPTPDELASAVSDSTETAQILIARPIYEYLKLKLADDAIVSRYVSDRIRAEIVRISKMTGGPVAAMMTPEARAKAMTTRWTRFYDRTGRTKGEWKLSHNTRRVRVYDDALMGYIRLDANRMKRPSACAEVIAAAIESGLDDAALSAYASSHDWTPDSYISVPNEIVDAVRVIATEKDIALAKIISFILASH